MILLDSKPTESSEFNVPDEPLTEPVEKINDKKENVKPEEQVSDDIPF